MRLLKIGFAYIITQRNLFKKSKLMRLWGDDEGWLRNLELSSYKRFKMFNLICFFLAFSMTKAYKY